MLGLFGLSVLPVSAAGVLLMLLAAVFFVVETFVPSHGALTAGGRRRVRARIAAPLRPGRAAPTRSRCRSSIAIACTIGLFMALVVAKLVQIRRKPVAVGVHELVGEHGVVREDGLVFVNGELWRAHRADGRALEHGRDVAVEGVSSRTASS